MADIVDADNGDYVNRVSIAVHTVERPGGEPIETLAMVVDAGIRLDLAELRRQVERLNWSMGDDEQLQHEVFTLQYRYDHTSWGADAAQLHFVLEIAKWMGAAAGGGIVGNYAYERMMIISSKIQHAKGPAWKPQELDNQMAIQRSRQMVEASYRDVDLSALSVQSSTITDGRATVVLRAGDGSVFTAQPELSDGGAIGTITRTYPSPG